MQALASAKNVDVMLEVKELTDLILISGTNTRYMVCITDDEAHYETSGIPLEKIFEVTLL